MCLVLSTYFSLRDCKIVESAFEVNLDAQILTANITNCSSYWRRSGSRIEHIVFDLDAL